MHFPAGCSKRWSECERIRTWPANDWLHNVQLQLTCFCCHGNSGVVTDDFEAYRLTTSGTTGFTLAGMMEEPACSSGRLISFRPARGPEESKRRSLQILDIFTAAFQRAVNHNISAAVGGRFDQVFSRYAWEASDFSQFFTASGEYSFGVFRPVPIVVAPRLTSSSSSAVRWIFSLLLSARC